MELNRQYIGARYVPKFYEGTNGTEWDSNVAYEPLTIVTYLSNSYTSKKAVPASIGDPVNNADYWASTGNYNAQVEAYREEVFNLVQNSIAVPELYGAKGDGVTDDTDAIIACLNENDCIMLNNDYKISSTITLDSHKHITGCGSIIRATSAFTIFDVKDAEDIEISGISFKDLGHYTEPLSDTADIYVKNSARVDVNNCYFYKTDNRGICYHKVTDSHIINNKFEESGYCAILLLGECDKILIDSNMFNEVVDYIHDNSYCIACSSYFYGGHNVTGNNYRNKNITINGNICKTTYGLWEALDCHGAVNITFSNNVIKGFKVGIAALGAALGSSGYSTEGCVIVGNSIDMSGTPYTGVTSYTGISCALGTDGLPASGTISGNTIICNDTLKNSYGITVQSDNALIDGNTIQGVDKGIYYLFGDKNRISNNILRGVVNGFEFYATTNICNCDFINNIIDGATLGIKSPTAINPSGSMFYFEGTDYTDVTTIIDNIANILPDAYGSVPSANKYAKANAKVRNTSYANVGDVLYYVSGAERHNQGLGSWGAIKSVSPV